MELIKFGADNLENLVAQGPSRLNRLPFGAVLVDAGGRIMKYNNAEGEITGRKPEEVVGKNFFTDVAPCTRGHLFQGKFQEGVAKGEVNTMFEYVFDHNMAPAKVRVHMKSTAVKDGIWIFVKRV
jgi:photoactive yellow protein